MSTILAPESIPCSVVLSRHLGRTAASFLQQLHYWLLKSKHVIEGARWVFNTLEDWAEQLGLSTASIVRAIALLREHALIRVERWNKHHWHQVNWYTIDYRALEGLISSIQSFCSSPSAHSEAIESANLSGSYQETAPEDLYLEDNNPTHPPVFVSENCAESDRVPILPELELDQSIQAVEERSASSATIAEDQSSAAPAATQKNCSADLITEAEVAIGCSMPHSIGQWLLRQDGAIVRTALAAIRQYRQKSSLQNGIATLRSAVQQRWKPREVRSNSPPVFQPADWQRETVEATYRVLGVESS